MQNEMSNKVFTLHIDPGHAWLQVPTGVLTVLGLDCVCDFSSYSYRDGANVYLEEDVDMPKFMRQFKAIVGTDLNYEEKFWDGGYECWIRNLPTL